MDQNNRAIFVFAPGENHIQHLERVFQSIAKHISIDFEFAVLLPNGNCCVNSEFPVVVKVISEQDLDLCNQLYFQEGRADIPAFATYAQLLLPKYFSEYSKIIFMEVDQLVQKDLAPLWQKCASEDIKIGAVRSRNSDGTFFDPPESFRKVAPSGFYFNMGFVIVDTAFWLENNFSERCYLECEIQKASKGSRFDFYAQGAMNNALHSYVTDLGFKYNVTGLGYKTDHDPKILDEAVILHWSGPRKPWNIDGLYKNLYFENYGKVTAFFDRSRMFEFHFKDKLREIWHRFLNFLFQKYNSLKIILPIKLKWKRDCRFLPLTNHHRELYEIIHHLCWQQLGEFPDLVDCRDFNDRIQWLKLFDQDREIIRCSNKILVREFIQERVGEHYLVNLYQVHDHFDQIDFDSLPDSFVIKTNHDSGTVILVKDKTKFDRKTAKKKIETALSKPYGWLNGEWAYSFVKPKVLVEEHIAPDRDRQPPDYKFHCVEGRFRWLQYIYDRGYEPKEVIIMPDGEVEKIRLNHDNKHSRNFEQPGCWVKMIEVAECLSKPFKYVRVDMYAIGSRIIVGELTFFPLMGCCKTSGQKKLGQLLDFDRTTVKPFLLTELKAERNRANLYLSEN